MQSTSFCEKTRIGPFWTESDKALLTEKFWKVTEFTVNTFKFTSSLVVTAELSARQAELQQYSKNESYAFTFIPIVNQFNED